DFFDLASALRPDLALHLHRLQEADRLVRLYLLPLLDEHLDDGPLHRGQDRPTTHRRPLRHPALAPRGNRFLARLPLVEADPEEPAVDLDLDLPASPWYLRRRSRNGG